MIAGSDFVRYLLSETGLILLFLAAAVWSARRPASVRARWTAVACALFFALISVYAGQYVIGRTIAAGFRPFRGNDAAPDRRTAIVVLGSGGLDVEDWDGGTFSVVDRAAATRVLEASRVFRMIDPAIVISSGGNAHTGDIVRPTGETMRDALVTIGVPRERIMVETVSRTTRDEAVVVAPMLKAQNVEQVVLVTSQTHMRRALGAFRAVGVRAIPAVAQEFDRQRSAMDWVLPTDEGLSEASNNVHELIGVVYYWLRGWWRR